MKTLQMLGRVIAFAMLLVAMVAIPVSAGEKPVDRQLLGLRVTPPVATVDGETFHVFYHQRGHGERPLNNHLAKYNCQLANAEQVKVFQKAYDLSKNPTNFEKNPAVAELLQKGLLVRRIAVRTDKDKVKVPTPVLVSSTR